MLLLGNKKLLLENGCRESSEGYFDKLSTGSANSMRVKYSRIAAAGNRHLRMPTNLFWRWASILRCGRMEGNFSGLSWATLKEWHLCESLSIEQHPPRVFKIVGMIIELTNSGTFMMENWNDELSWHHRACLSHWPFLTNEWSPLRSLETGFLIFSRISICELIIINRH